MNPRPTAPDTLRKFQAVWNEDYGHGWIHAIYETAAYGPLVDVMLQQPHEDAPGGILYSRNPDEWEPVHQARSKQIQLDYWQNWAQELLHQRSRLQTENTQLRHVINRLRDDLRKAHDSIAELATARDQLLDQIHNLLDNPPAPDQ